MFYTIKSRSAPGNCGMQFYDFYTAYGKKPKRFSFKLIAAMLNRSGGDGQKDGLNSLVAFSGNKGQLRGHYGPHAFAKWLVKQGEFVHESPWVDNLNTTHKIKGYFWAPSLKFRRAVAIEQVKMKTATELYNEYAY